MSYPTPPPTAAPIQPPAPPVQPGPPFRLPAGRRRTVVAELLKIWTTNTWWVLSICYAVGLGLTILVNTFTANDNINTASRSIGSTDGLSGDEIQKLNLAHDLPRSSATRRPTSTPAASTSARCSSCCSAS